MRIAMITQSFPPMVSGAAMFVKRLSAALKDRGHSVLVLAASESSTPSTITEQNLRIVKTRSLQNPFRVDQRFSFWPYQKMLKELYAFAPDIIHIHDPLQMGMISHQFSREIGIPIIVTVHALPAFITSYLPLPEKVKKSFESLLWNYASTQYSHISGIVVATETVAKIIRTHVGINPAIISCGIDLEKFSPAEIPEAREQSLRKYFGIPVNAPVILHVGRLDKDKNVIKVLEGTQAALQRTDAHLLIIGNGTEMENLKDLSVKLGIRQKVHFAGYMLDENELADIYRIARIFVTASQIETQGIVLLEAAACGLPIVAPACTSIPEIVHDQVNGFLFQPEDKKKMQESVLRLCEDPKLAKSMGKANSEIIKGHDFTHTVCKYESQYESCLSLDFNPMVLPLPMELKQESYSHSVYY